MRGIAEYAMSGRRQAVTLAIVFGLVPLLNILSGAIVALVTLRKGYQEGLLVLLWALLPAALHWYAGNAGPACMVVSAMLAGQVLRVAKSWQPVMLLITLVGVLIQPIFLNQLTEQIQRTIDQGGALLLAETERLGAATPQAAAAELLSLYVACIMVLFIACVMIARYWQAMLYNPGGFRSEFHSLRFDPRIMVFLLALLLAGLFGVKPMASWVPIFCVIPLFQALSLVHDVVARRKLGVNWLILTYMVTLFLVPATIGLGFVDSLLDLRKRVKTKDDGNNEEQ